MPVPLGRPQGESETHLAIFGKRRLKPFIQVSQAARSWATRCIGRRRTRGCWTPICKLWLLGSRCSAVAASVSKKPNLSLRAPSLVQNSQKPMNAASDSISEEDWLSERDAAENRFQFSSFPLGKRKCMHAAALAVEGIPRGNEQHPSDRSSGRVYRSCPGDWHWHIEGFEQLSSLRVIGF
jgi:hypothetical protein